MYIKYIPIWNNFLSSRYFPYYCTHPTCCYISKFPNFKRANTRVKDGSGYRQSKGLSVLAALKACRRMSVQPARFYQRERPSLVIRDQLISD